MHHRTLITTTVLLLLATTILADAPSLVNYQGRLTNASGTPLVGVYSVRFTIYDAASSGNMKWQEMQNVTTGSDGLFTVLLGSVVPLVDTVFRQPGRYLGIKVGSDPEMTPRSQIASVPYALNVAANYDPKFTWNSLGNADTLTTTMKDLITITISTPAPGYICVVGKGTAYLSGTTGVNYGYAQIDETAGGAASSPWETVFGAQAMWSANSVFFPFMVTKTFPKETAGTYTFRLEGVTGGSQGAGALITIRHKQIYAMYFPTMQTSGSAMQMLNGQ